MELLEFHFYPAASRSSLLIRWPNVPILPLNILLTTRRNIKQSNDKMKHKQVICSQYFARKDKMKAKVKTSQTIFIILIMKENKWKLKITTHVAYKVSSNDANQFQISSFIN